MIEAGLIIAFSVLLLAYWFRYTVLLLLSDEAAESEAIDSQLSLAQTRATLSSPQAELALDRLHGALEKDYRMLNYLLQHAASLHLRPVERALLTMDYQMLRIWYRLKPNRRALQEMAGVLQYMACKMGKQAGAAMSAAR